MTSNKTPTDKTTTAWDEAVLEVALEEVFAEAPEEALSPPSRRRPALIAAAALLVVALIAVLDRDRPGTEEGTSQDPTIAQHWGLLPGAEWTYETVRDGRTESRTWHAHGWIQSGQDLPVLQLRRIGDLEDEYRHYRIERSGIVELRAARNRRQPGFSTERPRIVLPLRLGIRTAWPVRDWSLQMDHFVVKFENAEARLQDPNAKVQVPAGEFECAQVRIADPNHPANSLEVCWSPKVGLVRQTLFQNGSVVCTQSLARFRAGDPALDSRGEVAARALEAHLGPQKTDQEPRWRWARLGANYVQPKSRFAVLPSGKVLRVHRSTVHEFLWSDREHVTAWLRDEQWFQDEMQPALTPGVALLLARCRAMARGNSVEVRPPKTVYASEAGHVGATINYGVDTMGGGGTAEDCRMTVEIATGGKVLKIVAQPLR